jgi:glutamate/tyrosine decarboxylase-like PLP-dependent enzyme
MTETSIEQRSGTLAELNASLRTLPTGFSQSLEETVGTRCVEAWFLGTKAENTDLFLRLVGEVIGDQASWRRNFHPEDPSHITHTIKQDPHYLEAVDRLEQEFWELLAFLKKSVPFFSMRYQGHMNWDLTIPGMLGYFAAMLYNPNNVALEGSNATTLMELDVGDDLCRMLGYSVPRRNEQSKGTRPWGHITCDGTVANIEALWSARNLKYFPLALREALLYQEKEGDEKGKCLLEAARAIDIALPGGGRARLLELSTWQLLNLAPDSVLELTERIKTEYQISESITTQAVGRHSLQRLGLVKFARKFVRDIEDPVVCVPGTRHYSFPKAVALLGLGSDGLKDIAVDLDARQSLMALRDYLEDCLAKKRPVLAVVAVIGTTEESAIDPLDDMVKLRDEFAKRGLVFLLHADAAWGGYHRSVINKDFAFEHGAVAFAVEDEPFVAKLSAYSERHLRALTWADSITVDPHKSGYIPYPAGALCYRNGAQRHLVSFSAPVVFRGNAEQTVGIYGIEGSKPGASVSAVYLSHKIIRPSERGYGQIIGRALLSCRKYYARLLTMAKEDDLFTVTPLPRLPAERDGGDVAGEKKKIFELIDQRLNQDIRDNDDAMALLREIGPDQNILSYAFNFRLQDGTVNQDLARANRLNLALYRKLSIKYGDDIYGYRLLVSSTDIEAATYGEEFVKNLKRRMGITSRGDKITVIRSVVMDPWITEVGGLSFVDTLEKEWRAALADVLPTIADATQMVRRGY